MTADCNHNMNLALMVLHGEPKVMAGIPGKLLQVDVQPPHPLLAALLLVEERDVEELSSLLLPAAELNPI